MAWFFSILIAAVVTAPNLVAYLEPWSRMTPDEQGQAVGYAMAPAITGFLLATVLQLLWNALRRPAREAGNLHSRVNVTAFLIGGFAAFVMYAASAPG